MEQRLGAVEKKVIVWIIASWHVDLEIKDKTKKLVKEDVIKKQILLIVRNLVTLDVIFIIELLVLEVRLMIQMILLNAKRIYAKVKIVVMENVKKLMDHVNAIRIFREQTVKNA